MTTAQPDLFSQPRSRRGEHTSKLAAERVATSAETIRRRVYAIVLEAGAYGVTGSEVVERMGLDAWVVRPRLTELKDSGMIRKTEHTRLGSSGTAQRVWRAVG